MASRPPPPPPPPGTADAADRLDRLEREVERLSFTVRYLIDHHAPADARDAAMKAALVERVWAATEWRDGT